jgi:hypothetical protein
MERAPDLRVVLWLLDGDVRAAITSHSHTLENIVERAFAFALWCLDPNQARSVRETARRIFFTQLATMPEGRHELASRLPAAVLSELRPWWEQHVPADDFAALEADVARVHGELWGKISTAPVT